MSARRPKCVRRGKKWLRIREHQRERERRRADARQFERVQFEDRYIYVLGHRVKGLCVRQRDAALGTLVFGGTFAKTTMGLLPIGAFKPWPEGPTEPPPQGPGVVRLTDWVHKPIYSTVTW